MSLPVVSTVLLFTIIDISLCNSKLKEHILVDELIEMLKSYESYRSNPCRVMRPVYENRYRYIEREGTKSSKYVKLFMDYRKVLYLVDRQRCAHLKAATAEPGWQMAMMDAGIWNDDKETF